jgi:hypothetical protein
MTEKTKKEPTRQMAIPESVAIRLENIKKECKQRSIKQTMQGMAIEAFTAYCDDMELELSKSE